MRRIMLATVKHECPELWHSIEDVGKGQEKPYGVPLTVGDDRSGKKYTDTYYGRGYPTIRPRTFLGGSLCGLRKGMGIPG